MPDEQWIFEAPEGKQLRVAGTKAVTAIAWA
jgi:hypothetical protein